MMFSHLRERMNPLEIMLALVLIVMVILLITFGLQGGFDHPGGAQPPLTGPAARAPIGQDKPVCEELGTPAGALAPTFYRCHLYDDGGQHITTCIVAVGNGGTALDCSY